MSHRVGIRVLAVLACWPLLADAEIYKCTKPDGKSAFQDSPCASVEDRKAVVDLAGAKPASPLAAARRGFKTQITLPSVTGGPAPTPPGNVLAKVSYASPVGQLAAYLSPAPAGSEKSPAIIWITGGDSNSLDNVWSPRSRSNDQSAAAFRKAGIVTMFPSLRGGNDNPGNREGFYGEVDDILAAADFLARQPYVDPTRIYLGGHSTGGTLALLTGESSSRFRAVFAYGPVSQASDYGRDLIPVDFGKYDPREAKLRAPASWLSAIRSRVFVIEGVNSPNISALRSMQQQNGNPQVSFLAVAGASHFSVLAPANELIARKILADTGPSGHISLSEAELAAAVRGGL